MSFKKWLGSNNGPRDKDTSSTTLPSGSRNGSITSSALSAVNSNANHLETTDSGIPEVEEEGGYSGSATTVIASEPIPTATVEFPFGDGSDKIFGMENFGNTCYCNSIVQSLYYHNDFRRNILRYPIRDTSAPRDRRLSMPGSRPHPATKAELHPESEKDTTDSKQRVTLARRTSNFFVRTKRDSNEDEEDTTTNAPPQTQTNPNMTVITIPNIRLAPSNIVIGKTDDQNPTVDGRKRAALIKGPIINMDHSLTDDKPTLFTALKDLFEAETEHDSKLGVVSPSFLVETLKKENELFRSAMHQDAHEFLNFLLNEVIDSVDVFKPESERNAIRDLFEGLLTNQTKCLTCENVTSRDETFLDLSLDLTDGETLESCLKQFSASEMLAGSNKFYCDNCHSLQEAEKKMGLRKLPKVLALHLKRFKYSEEYRRNVKLFHKMKYPLHFKLESDIPAEKPEDGVKFYELYAVVVHIGGGPHHGHYVALVKTAGLGWLLFDDETVEKIDEAFVLRFVGDSPDLATAYVLFYQEISESQYDSVSKDLEPSLSAQTSQPIMNGFNTDFNLNMKPAEVKPPTDETDSISPLDKLTKVSSTDFSINSSQPSTLSSDKTKPTDGTNTVPSSHSVSRQTSTNFVSRLKNKSSVASSVPNGTPPPSSEGKSGFWRRDAKNLEKTGDKEKKDSMEKEKKKNRMSMSFNFKKSGV